MATTVPASLKWRLRKFSLFKQVSKKESGKWKHFEAVDGKPELMFNIAESGHVWVTQSQEILDFTVLPGARVHPNLDVLVIRSSVQGESRIMRVMFAGSSREEAVEQCSRALAKLKQFVVISSPPPPPPPPSCIPLPPPHRPPADPGAPAEQSGPVGAVVHTGPEVAHGSLSIRHLAQSLLGERALSLPEMYHRWPLPQGGDNHLGPFVRMCLLDPGFPAYVEEVERELKKLAQD